MAGLIVNLRAPSGGGKSYVGSKLYADFGPPVDELRSTDYFNKKKPKLVAEILPGDLCMAGRYQMKKSTLSAAKGYSTGVDGFFPVDDLERLLTRLADEHEFLFMESLMLSGTYTRWAEWAKKRKQDVKFVTLDTPAEKCIERIYSRNGGNPIKEHTIVASRRAVTNAHKKFEKDGTGILVPHMQSYETVLGLFVAAGWNPGKPLPPVDVPVDTAESVQSDREVDLASIIGPSPARAE